MKFYNLYSTLIFTFTIWNAKYFLTIDICFQTNNQERDTNCNISKIITMETIFLTCSEW